MPLPGPIHIPPIGEQTDPTKVRVAAVVGGQLASAPARGFGLTVEELTAIQNLVLSGGGSMTAAQILTLLKTVDGTGSGLDADLLDGHDSAYFLDFPEAPNDASRYARFQLNWVAIPKITVASTAPSSPAVNDVWIDTT